MFMWSFNFLQIEEEIVEVVEYKSDDDGDDGLVTAKVTPNKMVSDYPSMHSLDCILADISYDVNSVEFPEFGVNLIGKENFIKPFFEDLLFQTLKTFLGSLFDFFALPSNKQEVNLLISKNRG